MKPLGILLVYTIRYPLPALYRTWPMNTLTSPSPQSHPWSLVENLTLCNQILDFLTSRPQTVQTGSHTSSVWVLNRHNTPVTALLDFRRTLLYVCGRHRHHQPRYKQRWESILGRNQQSCRLVHREQSTAESFDLGLNAARTLSHRAQMLNVSGC